MFQHLCIPKIFFTGHLNSILNAEGDSIRILLEITPNEVLFVVVLCCFIILVCGKGVI